MFHLLVCHCSGRENWRGKAPAGATDTSRWTRVAQWVPQWHTSIVPTEWWQARRHLHQCQGRGVFCAGVGTRWEIRKYKIQLLTSIFCFFSSCCLFLSFPFFFSIFHSLNLLLKVLMVSTICLIIWIQPLSIKPHKSCEHYQLSSSKNPRWSVVCCMRWIKDLLWNTNTDLKL